MRNVLGDTERFFAQRRPGTGFETIYTAKGGEILYYINVANVNQADCRWYFCISTGNKPYRKSNAIVWAENLSANDNDVWGYQIPLMAGQKIGVRSSEAGAITFTVYGTFA